MVDGNHFAVYLGSNAFTADIRVDFKGKIQRCRTGRKLDHIPLRGEYEYLTGKEVNLQGFHELLGIIHILLPFQGLAQPCQLYLFLILGNAFFIFPMGGDTVLSDLDVYKRQGQVPAA